MKWSKKIFVLPLVETNVLQQFFSTWVEIENFTPCEISGVTVLLESILNNLIAKFKNGLMLSLVLIYRKNPRWKSMKVTWGFYDISKHDFYDFWDDWGQSLIIPEAMSTAWKVPKHGAFSGPYFPVFSPNTGKYGPEKTPNLDTFQAVREDKINCYLPNMIGDNRRSSPIIWDFYDECEHHLELLWCGRNHPRSLGIFPMRSTIDADCRASLRSA